MTWLGRHLGRGIMKITGWSYEAPPEDWARRQVVIAYPHTSWYDAVLSFSLFQIIDKPSQVLIKAEAFRGPLGALLRAFGAIPITRGHKGGAVAGLVAELEHHDEVALCIMPEGTRKQVEHIKSGFWHIASAAGVQIMCTHVDVDRKHISWLGAVQPSGDMIVDMYAIQDLYAAAGSRIPLPKGVPSRDEVAEEEVVAA